MVMEKEKEAVKEKTDIALKGSSFSSPRSLAREYLKKHIRESKDLGLPKERKYDINDELDKSALKNTYDRLSKKTREKLELNYNHTTIAEILEALGNFESIILISCNVPKLADVMKKDSLRKKKEIGKAIRLIDLLMKNTLIADIKPLKENLLIVRKALEKNMKKFKTVKINGIGLAKLYDMLLDPMSTSYFLLYDIDPETYVKEILFLIPEQQKGRPSKIFLKALQIIIYKLLTLEPPKTKRQYIQWAKELTATIIEDFFARWKYPSFYAGAAPDSGVGSLYKTFGPWKLPKLTAKDVDTALHSTS